MVWYMIAKRECLKIFKSPRKAKRAKHKTNFDFSSFWDCEYLQKNQKQQINIGDIFKYFYKLLKIEKQSKSKLESFL